MNEHFNKFWKGDAEAAPTIRDTPTTADEWTEADQAEQDYFDRWPDVHGTPAAAAPTIKRMSECDSPGMVDDEGGDYVYYTDHLAAITAARQHVDDDAERHRIHRHQMDTNKHYRERVFNTIVELDAKEGIKRFARLASAGAGSDDQVVEANRKLLLDRSRVGIEKYRVTLADSGLSRSALAQHALEEALDLANYLQTILHTEAASTQSDQYALSTVRAQVADDGYAMSFQSMGQYRTALLKAIDAEALARTTNKENGNG